MIGQGNDVLCIVVWADVGWYGLVWADMGWVRITNGFIVTTRHWMMYRHQHRQIDGTTSWVLACTILTILALS